MTKRKTHVPAVRGGNGQMAGTALVPLQAHAAALATRTDGTPGEPIILREGGTTLIIGQPYPIGDVTIRADAVYYVGDIRDDLKEGRWLHEADKVAWFDSATGYECIMMRDVQGGFLSGYVGVPPSHPLYGFDHAAVPVDLGIEVHGGLNYSKICDTGPTPASRPILRESRRVCHTDIRIIGYEKLTHATDYRVQHADAWWFGFSCDHRYDVVPKANRQSRYLSAETGAVYRDDAYVCHEVQTLAAQLKAIADGLPVLPRRDPPPPVGLDQKGER